MSQPIAAAVVTTFPNSSWKIYSKIMLKNFVAFWPKEIPILIQTDDNLLEEDIKKIIRPQDGFISGWSKEHADFFNRNKDKDDSSDYRKQAVRFCHKVFALKFACDSALKARESGAPDAPRYLIWMDGDVITTAQVTFNDLIPCLPKEGDAVAYLGRKDWDHSECGWLAFDLHSGGNEIIYGIYEKYVNDEIFNMEQWHDSFIFDEVTSHCKGSTRKVGTSNVALAVATKTMTNLTLDKPGMDIWQHSPMAKFSTHHKGPVAKDMLANPNQQMPKGSNLKIQTKNSIPDESIQRNILENQAQIKNWVSTCDMHDEEIVVVSAGPSLIAEDLLDEVRAGRKIVAVKHALDRLKESNIKPWACILLDPRPHVYDFVENPDTSVLWFVASQVVPKAVKKLLDAGCTVWGYHAAVNANEKDLIEKQYEGVVHGGSATATRGLYLLEKLGFRNFRLYGYDLSFQDKPDLSTKDDIGQPKYFEVCIGVNEVHYQTKATFWSDGQLLAQREEMQDILTRMPWKLRAFGKGIIPFMVDARRISELRGKAKKAKLGVSKSISYEELLGCNRKIKSLPNLRNMLQRRLRKLTKASSS